MDERERDQRVLELRAKRRSFAAIARMVGYERSDEAVAAFNRELRRRPAKEQEALRQAELARLDGIVERVRADEDLTPEVADRRVRNVTRLRTRLLAP